MLSLIVISSLVASRPSLIIFICKFTIFLCPTSLLTSTISNNQHLFMLYVASRPVFAKKLFLSIDNKKNIA